MNLFAFNSRAKAFKLCLLALLAPIGVASLHGAVEDDVAAARVAWEAEDAPGAIAILESALTADPAHEEANFLLGMFKLAEIAEDPTFEALMTDAGIGWDVDNFSDIDVEYDVYMEATSVDTNAAAWTHQTVEYSEIDLNGNVDAAQSGSITHNQISAMEVELTGSGQLMFDYKVSTEAYYDFLEVYVDGELILSSSGESFGWSRQYWWVEEDGEHQLLFIYRKDVIVDGGSDAVWIDSVSFNNETYAPSVPNSLSDALDNELVIDSVTGAAVEAFTSTGLPIFDDAFTTTHFVNWLSTSMAPRLLEAQLLFERVSSTSFLLDLSASETFGISQAVDYYDVLMLRAATEGLLAVIGILDEHNIDVFMDALTQRHLESDPSLAHLEWIFETYPDLLELSPTADLSQEEQALRNLKDLYFQASDGIFARSAEVRRLFNVGKEHAAPDTAWFAQTVESYAGGDAVKSGNIKSWLSGWGSAETSMSLTVEGPGVLTFWWKMSNYEGVMYPDQGLYLYRRDYSWNEWLGSVWGEQDWTQVTVNIPAGVQTLEWRYSLYDDRLSEADGGFVDQVVYTPEGGSAIELQPSASSLDAAIDASLNASSENITVNSFRLSALADFEIRHFLADMVSSLDGVADTSVGDFTLRPLFDLNADLVALRPDFDGNQILPGTIPDSTFAGILPNMIEHDLQLELQSYLLAYRLMLNSSLGGFGNGGGLYEIGVTAAITAIADEGYRFAGWVGDGVADPDAAITEVLMDKDRFVAARFLVNSTDGYNTMLSAFSGETDINRIGPAGDFDGDSISNFEEYIFGSNPASAADRFTVDPIAETVGLSSNLLVNLTVRSDDSDLIYYAYVSPDLSSWTRVTLIFNGSTWLTSDASELAVESAESNGDGTWSLILKGKSSVTNRSFIQFEVSSPY